MEPQLPENESARMNALRQYKILDTPPEAAFDDAALLAAHICQTPIALVSLVDSDRQWFKSKIGLEIEQTERAISFCAHAILEPDDVFVIPDAALDERFARNPLVTDAPHIRFYAGVPLVDRDGYPLGALCVLDHQPRELKAEQIAALRTLRRQLVTELELRRAISERDQIQNTLVQTQDELKTRSETEIALLQAKGQR